MTTTMNDQNEDDTDQDDDDNDDNEDDDNDGNEDKECVDFKYPLEISVFDRQSELIETVTFNTDKELFTFVKNLSDDDVAAIKFPISIVVSGQSEVTLTELEELEDTIEDAIDNCN